jgi:proton-translocating NADH-quinone oxidoreductase chain M
MLVLLILPLCLFFGLSSSNVKLYFYLFFFLSFSLIITFLTENILIFYISFELVTILMYFILIYFGYEQRRVLASYYFFYFTFFGSFLFLAGVIIISFFFGTNLNLLLYFAPLYSLKYKHYLWWSFFFAFAIKIPMFPFHIWLPEAHVEAPTGGSIMLASVLLKVGYYGFYKIMIPLFFTVFQTYLPLLYTFCFFGITHSMLVSLRQIDLKRIIAYSSIAHMNFALLGLFSFTLDGITGSFLLMLAHGFISAGLFALVGFLYQRFGTRSLYYYGGLAKFMPKFAFVFFLFILGNISFPLTFAFPAEVLIIFSLVKKSKLIFLFVIPGLVLNLINSILLFSRLFFGSIKNLYVPQCRDLNTVEFYSMLYLLFFVFFFGFFPDVILDLIYFDVSLDFSFLKNWHAR